MSDMPKKKYKTRANGSGKKELIDIFKSQKVEAKENAEPGDYEVNESVTYRPDLIKTTLSEYNRPSKVAKRDAKREGDYPTKKNKYNQGE